MAASKNYRI